MEKIFHMLVNHDGTTERFEGTNNPIGKAFQDGYCHISYKDRSGDFRRGYRYVTVATIDKNNVPDTFIWAEDNLKFLKDNYNVMNC